MAHFCELRYPAFLMTAYDHVVMSGIRESRPLVDIIPMEIILPLSLDSSNSPALSMAPISMPKRFRPQFFTFSLFFLQKRSAKSES